MKPLNDILSDVQALVSELEVKKLELIRDRSEISDKLAICNYWLVGHRDFFKKKWEIAYSNCPEKSHVSKERFADNQVPELYTIRHVMGAIKLLIDSLRTSISANKG